MDICFYEMEYFDYPIFRLGVTVAYSVSSFIATVLNFLILVSIWKTPSLHNPSYLLVANLALSDFINGALGEPFMVGTNIVALKNMKNSFCYIWKSARAITYCTASVSLQTLALISVDRLLAVRLMNRYRSVVTLKRCGRLVLVWWIGSILLAHLVFLNVKIERLKHLLLMIEIFMFLLLSVVCVCYGVAFYSLKKITSLISPVTSNPTSNIQRSNIDVIKYRKSLKTMVLVFTVIMLFYIPYVSISFAAAFSFSSKVPKKNDNSLYMGFLTSELIMITNSSMNPLLYLWRMQEIRGAVKTTVKKIFRQEQYSNSR